MAHPKVRSLIYDTDTNAIIILQLLFKSLARLSLTSVLIRLILVRGLHFEGGGSDTNLGGANHQVWLCGLDRLAGCPHLHTLELRHLRREVGRGLLLLRDDVLEALPLLRHLGAHQHRLRLHLDTHGRGGVLADDFMLFAFHHFYSNS